MLNILQIANIGPITYGLLRHCLKSPPPQHLAVSLLLGVGCAASLGLVLGWDLTSIFGSGEEATERSVGLFVAVFCLALVDKARQACAAPLGVVTQISSAVGAEIMFILVNEVNAIICQFLLKQ